MTKAIARLRKLSTDDGLVQFHHVVPIGKVYQVDLDTRRSVMLFNTDKGVEHQKDVVWTLDGTWLPVECLELEEVAEKAKG